jgi:hypothetical protein
LEGNGHNPTVKGPSSTLTLTITYDQMSGAIGVNAPVQNLLLCYGMLEMARQTIQNFAEAQAKQQRIIPANVMPMIRPA